MKNGFVFIKLMVFFLIIAGISFDCIIFLKCQCYSILVMDV